MDEVTHNGEKVRGNPVIPPAPVPSLVRMSRVPEPPPPIPKGEGGEKIDLSETVPPSGEGLKEEEVEVDLHPKGIIIIKVFENSPYEVEFSGVITGSEIDTAWKAMMKEYRVWKHTLFRKNENGGV